MPRRELQETPGLARRQRERVEREQGHLLWFP